MQALGLVWENVTDSGEDVREIRSPIAEPTLYGARLLLEEWWARQPHGGIVLGRDLPSRTLGCVLRNLAVYQPLDLGRDYRIRLAGAAFLRRFGREIGGLLLSQYLDAAPFRVCCEEFGRVLAIGAPVMHHVRFVRSEKTLAEFETLALRILSAHGSASWVLGGLFFKDWA